MNHDGSYQLLQCGVLLLNTRLIMAIDKAKTISNAIFCICQYFSQHIQMLNQLHLRCGVWHFLMRQSTALLQPDPMNQAGLPKKSRKFWHRNSWEDLPLPTCCIFWCGIRQGNNEKKPIV